MTAPPPETAAAPADGAISGLRRIFRFLVTGGTGFLVDAGVLSLVLATTAIGPIGARCLSFPAALLVTWTLNRTWSFGDRGRPRLSAELAGYVGVQVVGFLINSGIYVVLVTGIGGMQAPALVALFFGSAAAAFVTFALLNLKLYGR
ncbi:GtrA family protein [Amorphus coralli]|uniref:GtrA family protein n=1 Tax=Amorphus coralli TaxID=340680 RepID=UPI00036F973D|nr:GtrA family protein [Amorphus coralli]